MTRKYKWRPDLPDHRDHLFAPEPAVVAAPLPTSVDLRSGCSPVEDQGQLGSCTGNALVGAVEFLHRKLLKDTTDFSRLFVYYNERAMEGTIRQDSGAAIRDGVQSLVRQGVCTEAAWPYDITKFKNKPPVTCYKAAQSNRITSYQRLNTLSDMKHCLAAGYPFVFGFTVYAAFESDEVARTGVLNLPTVGEEMLGGHAVMCVGYDDATQRFLVRNSWGPNWGQAGYFTIPYAYVTNPNLASDFWTIRK